MQRPIRISRRDSIDAKCRRPDARVKISATKDQIALGISLVLNMVCNVGGAGIAVNAVQRETVGHHAMARVLPEICKVRLNEIAQPAVASRVGSRSHEPDCLPTRSIQSSGGVTIRATLSCLLAGIAIRGASTATRSVSRRLVHPSNRSARRPSGGDAFWGFVPARHLA